jgi:hypothetical protein
MEQRYIPLAVEIFPGIDCDFSTYLAKRAGAQSGACAEVQIREYGTELWSPGSRIGSRKHCDISTYLAKREREQSGAFAEVSFLIMEQCCDPLAIEIIPGKHCDFSTYLAKRATAQSGACAEVHFPDYGTELLSPGSRNVPGNTVISAHILQRERELSLAHAQRCSFLIMEQCSGPLAVENVPGKQERTAISAPNLPRERKLNLAHAQRCSFLILEQCCGPLALEMIPGKHCDFST